MDMDKIRQLSKAKKEFDSNEAKKQAKKRTKDLTDLALACRPGAIAMRLKSALQKETEKEARAGKTRAFANEELYFNQYSYTTREWHKGGTCYDVLKHTNVIYRSDEGEFHEILGKMVRDEIGYVDAYLRVECEAAEFERIVVRASWDWSDSYNQPQYKYKRLVEFQQIATKSKDFELLAEKYSKLNYSDSAYQATVCKLAAETLAEAERLEAERKRLEKERQQREEEEAIQLSRYNALVEKMKTADSSASYAGLAREFEDMDGYKDTLDFAAECKRLILVAKEKEYNNFVAQKVALDTDKSRDIDAYEALASSFADMGDSYKDAITHSSDCEKRIADIKDALAEEKRIRIELWQAKEYDKLIEQTKNAPDESQLRRDIQLRRIIRGFGALGDYKDAAILTKKYRDIYNSLTQARREQEVDKITKLVNDAQLLRAAREKKLSRRGR